MKSKEPAPWQVLNSQYIVQDEWLTVRADDCRASDGAELSPYYVLEYPDWVSIAAFNDQEELLLIWQYRHGLGKVCIELPGGKVDAEDSSFLDTASRELLEETGCSCQRYEHIGSFAPNPATHTNVDHFVLGLECRQTAEQALDVGEEIRAEFVGIDRVLQLIRDGEFQQGRQIAVVYMALEKLGRLRFE